MKSEQKTGVQKKQQKNILAVLIIPLILLWLWLDDSVNCLCYQSAHSVWDQTHHAVAKPNSPGKDIDTAVHQ